MKVGDLVRIKYDGVVTSQSRYDGVVALIVEVEVCQADTDYPGAWFHLLNQPVPFRANKLEVINASR